MWKLRRLFLLCVMCFGMQSANAIVMLQDGLSTDYGFVSWKSLVNSEKQIGSLENQVKLLRTMVIVGSVIAAGVFIYQQWYKKTVSQDSMPSKIDDSSELNFN